jgi:hypothetical protein
LGASAVSATIQPAEKKKLRALRAFILCATHARHSTLTRLWLLSSCNEIVMNDTPEREKTKTKKIKQPHSQNPTEIKLVRSR